MPGITNMPTSRKCFHKRGLLNILVFFLKVTSTKKRLTSQNLSSEA